MNWRLGVSLVFGSVLVLVAAGITTSNGQALHFIREVPIGSDFFGLVIQAGTDGWVSLEASPELHTWREVASIASTNDATLFVDEANVQTGERFYRLRLPGTSPEEAQARWLAINATRYSFQLERVSTTESPYVLTGTVTVINGQKSVTNATGDGQLVGQVDPADFPSVEELLAALKSAQLAGCRQVYGIYDDTLGFPVRCLIDQRVTAFPPADQGNALEYRITGLQVLGQAVSANKRMHRTSR